MKLDMIKENTRPQEWFEREEDWVSKAPFIFSRPMVQFTFLEIGRLIKLLGGVEKSSQVLDLCCGIGRHSIELARHGLQVTGVDITKPFIETATSKARAEGLGIRFICANMKEFIQPDTFDLVVNLCSSFGYFDDIDDDIKVLRNIYASLKHGGRFAIEILGKEVIASRFNKVEKYEFGGYKVVATSRILNDWSSLECKRLITKDGVETEVVGYNRLYSAVEMKQWLKTVGFKNIQVFGTFAGAPYDSEAKSMIVISEK
jgi:SAM-dependent methyltransferase